MNASDISIKYEQILEKFVLWAQEQPSIRAALVLGSRARQADHPADEFSDLDILVIASDPQIYLDQADWVDVFGDSWLTFVEATPDGGGSERRVLYAGGLDVDFAFVPLALLQNAPGQAAPPIFADIVRRGVRVVLDKDSLLADLPSVVAAWQPPALPTQAEFTQVVGDFWYHAVWSAKHLRRGELWWAKSALDDRMKYLLKNMLEWHALAARGPSHDTWMRGRFIEEWADPRAIAELRWCFAHYDQDDLWQALFATMRLFRWLMEETAANIDLAYAQEGIAPAEALVNQLGEWTRPVRSSKT